MAPANPSALVIYKTVASGAVGANTEQTITVPATVKGWYLYSVTISLVQGITQTPQPLLQFKDAAGNLFLESIGSTAAQAVSTTCIYNWASGMVPTGQIGVTTGVHSNAVIPDGLILPPNFVVNTLTLGIGANTAYGVMRLMVGEFQAMG